MLIPTTWGCASLSHSRLAEVINRRYGSGARVAEPNRCPLSIFYGNPDHPVRHVPSLSGAVEAFFAHRDLAANDSLRHERGDPPRVHGRDRPGRVRARRRRHGTGIGRVVSCCFQCRQTPARDGSVGA